MKVRKLFLEDSDEQYFDRLDEDPYSPELPEDENEGKEASQEINGWVIEDGNIICSHERPSFHPYTGEKLEPYSPFGVGDFSQ